MKKSIRSFIAVILAISCSVIIACPVFAVEAMDAQLDMRIRQVVEAKIEAISSDDATLTIARMKRLSDFDENTYLLFECDPAGYLIFDPVSATFVEYSVEAISPYLGKTNNLFYGGPTYYYTGDDGGAIYSHTILHEEVPYNNDLIRKSKEIKSALKQSKNEAIAQYISGKSQLSTFDLTAQLDGVNEDALETDTYIEHYNWIRNLVTAKQCGYYCPSGSGGLCGYVAGGMVLLYFQRKNNLDLIPSKYLDSTGWFFNGGDFTKLLREEYGTYDSTTAVLMLDVLTAYIPPAYTFTRYTYLLPTAGEIRSHINRDHPVMLFGNLYSPNDDEYYNHAVVVYGYSAENELIAHFGWNNSYAIYVQSTLPFGSALVIGDIS